APPPAARRCGLRAARGLRVPGSGGLPVRHSPAGEPGAAEPDRAPPEAARGMAAPFRAALLRQLPLSGAELEPGAPSRREGGVAPRRAVPARRLHRDQPASPGQEGGRLLQRARDGGAVDQRGKTAVKWTRLSGTTFPANAVRLQLHALAYNLANFLRTLALPTAIADWSLTSLREKVVKIGAKVVAHGRYLVFQMAEVAVPRELFRGILQRIAGLRPAVVARC